MPVGEMLDRMSGVELAEWMAYDLIEPIGPERADIQAARITAQLANIYRDPKARPEPFTIAEFLPQFGKMWYEQHQATQAQDGKDAVSPADAAKDAHWRAVLNKVVAINKALGGKDLRSQDGNR